MKLFGKKDDTPPTDAPDIEGADDGSFGEPDAAPAAEGAPDDASLGEAPPDGAPDELAEGGELTAPARPAAQGGSKKKLIIGGVALLLLAAAGGGGYFYFMMGSDTPMPPHPVPPMTAAVTPPAATPPAATPAAPGMPAAPAATAAANPLAPAPALTPPGAPAAAPGAPAAAPGIPGMPAAPPLTASATPPTPPGLGPPPGDEANAIAPPPSMPAGTAVPTPAAPAAMATPATVAAKPPGAMSAPGIEAPGEEPPADLPMPAGVTPTPPMPSTAATTAPAMPVAATAAATAAATPSATAAAAAAAKTPDGKGKAPAGKNGEPSEAEKAIVQNAAVLDQLSPNNNRPFDPNQAAPDQSASVKTIDQLLAQPAIVRPLPPSWLTVKKERASDDVDTHLTVAREALAQNNNTAALQLFTELKGKYPKDKRILMGRAVALQKLGQDDAALGAYEAVLTNDPKNLEALTNMLGLLKKKDPKLAVSKLEQLRDTYPYNADITAQLGIACGAAGQYDDALRYLDMADALSPGSAYIVYNKAVLYDRMGRSQQAGEFYREVIRMASDGDLNESLPLDAIKRRLAILH